MKFFHKHWLSSDEKERGKEKEKERDVQVTFRSLQKVRLKVVA